MPCGLELAGGRHRRAAHRWKEGEVRVCIQWFPSFGLMTVAEGTPYAFGNMVTMKKC